MTRSTWIALGALVVATAGFATAARADYEIRGRFLYLDRETSLTGFTGIEIEKPIRYAPVEVVDDATQQVIGGAATGFDGRFSLRVTDNTKRTLRVRAVTRAVLNLPFDVLVPGTGAAYAVAFTVAGHTPDADIDFDEQPVTALPGAGGDAFNIRDQGIDAFFFIHQMEGAWPVRALRVFWKPGFNNGTVYLNSSATIFLLGRADDSEAYDDAVILHEIGHYVEATYATFQNPGGVHTLNGFYDLRLAWSEGQATFFSCLVRDWRLDPRPDLYVDTTGEAGPGHALLSYDVESPSAGQRGANNEVSVTAVLWDLVDDATSRDLTPSQDDEIMQLAGGRDDYWQTYRTRMSIATSASLEDFWDGWFFLGKGHLAEMRDVFSRRGVEYFDDSNESDDTWTQARPVVANSPHHHTLYGVGDEDWIKVGVVSNQPYVFETKNLLSGADTQLDLFAADGTTLIASNDNRAAGDVSSQIAWTAPASSPVLLRAKRKADAHTYGSYDLLVTGAAVSVDAALPAVAPPRVALHAATPNPFNPTTTLAFDIPRPGPATLNILRVDGRIVRTLWSAPLNAGTHRLTWNGQDDQGAGVASGVYVARLTTAGGEASQRLVLVR